MIATHKARSLKVKDRLEAEIAIALTKIAEITIISYQYLVTNDTK